MTALTGPRPTTTSSDPTTPAVVPADLPGLFPPPVPLSDRSLVEEQTAGLFDRIAEAAEDERAGLVEQVVVLNLPLADAMARRFRNRGEEDDDLVQVARSGLTEAVQRYEPDRGPFAGFAVPTILGLLKRHFRDRGWMVRPPRRCQEVVLSIRRAWPELTQELGGEPTDADLARHLGETRDAVAQARRAEQGYRPVALDVGPSESGRTGTDGAGLEPAEARMLIEHAVGELDEKERRLVWMRFYQQRTQSDIAAELGTSQMQVSRLLARVMAHLRDVIGDLDDEVPHRPPAA